MSQKVVNICIEERELKNKISILLRLVRAVGSVTQDELAATLGIAQSTVSRIEDRRLMCSIPELAKICLQFNIPIQFVTSEACYKREITKLVCQMMRRYPLIWGRTKPPFRITKLKEEALFSAGLDINAEATNSRKDVKHVCNELRETNYISGPGQKTVFNSPIKETR
jgi:DNA-binding XRE family transcriptional regulator